VNDKFERLRHEVLDTFRAQTLGDLAPLSTDDLDASRLEDWQVRLYHLWERLKQFRPASLDEAETRDREVLAAHIERSLSMLHGASGRR
jgi:hypothetical protein